MTLDSLPNTSSTHTQTMLDSVPYALFSALGCEGQQLFDALLASELDELRLASQRELGVMPLAGDGVFVREKGIRGRAVLDGVGARRGWQDLVRRVLGEEALQTGMQLLREFDVAHIQRHLGWRKLFAASLATVREVDVGREQLKARTRIELTSWKKSLIQKYLSRIVMDLYRGTCTLVWGLSGPSAVDGSSHNRHTTTNLLYQFKEDKEGSTAI